jgi:endonuclease YncB( thermonuclease family)
MTIPTLRTGRTLARSTPAAGAGPRPPRARRRPRRSARLGTSALVAVLACIPAAAAAERAAAADASARTFRGTLTRALGTNVVHVRVGGHSTAVRLLGVGDPARAAGARGPCLREGAAELLVRLAGPRGAVRLVTDPRRPLRDPRGRLLAYVYRRGASGAASLNRAVVAAGWAPRSPDASTLAYGEALARAEARARRARLARWGAACALSTVAGVQRRLADLGYLPREAVTGSLDARTQHALMALEGWEGLVRDGVLDDAARERLARARRPAPREPAGRHLEVHIDRQVLLLVAGGRTVRAIHVSTGAGGRTPRGRFRVIRRELYSWSRPFSVWMKYAMYFHGGFALHEYPYVPGYPASHGCIRLPAAEASVVWSFAGLGTPVLVL